MSKKINLLNLNREGLCKLFLSIGEYSFRSNQLMSWIYQKDCLDFRKMTNFSSNLINKLEKISCIILPKLFRIFHSCDGTIKILIEVGYNQYIETVYIPYKNRTTLCLSSQIGCILDCKFCCTGKQPFVRNLFVFEIIGQILLVKKMINHLKLNNNKSITNIVFMGMGEPLLNFKNLVVSIKIILDKFGLGLSKRKVVISTSGIIPAIHELFKNIDVVLAISLHASSDVVRDSIMPINKRYKIKDLINTVAKYMVYSRANCGVISIEYIMIDGINDTKIDVFNLINLLKNIPSKINLIPLNNFSGLNYSCSNNKKIKYFFDILTQYGFIVTIRKSRGADIYASCGQLSGVFFK
ncbi:23S rRNA (adenine(2503)-C(2))-methyltransferase RlmN [Candidatus Purcelliella pentastirinorum]|uniref:Dual-specificity RNA methyltransferase RlmN n=1 Tax=Candidatus Purcelliella pentastirinorum TaxID=472834 RepID=A0AAX3N7V1_9ENTR|nr:23S rRNA (adenine(2503)-C(2))-methyltransferase RlmN [Candidatus Purcelliella pentastirinorum]WDI78458.1 23S rRNA (adenine(2503)-C(2))-methyltransferase RlmN [Candidatus Purcelliella pentastirinorum]WDR80513.1 23S rRNA (adenine(2503)-C(2))-methyltransferase RlmN [Candidatus Purcelliella pentastirinorum]